MAQIPRSVSALVLIAVASASAVAAGQGSEPVAVLVAHAGEYVKAYEQQLTSVVGEEHQVQRLVTPAGVVSKQRDLISDVLLVKGRDFGSDIRQGSNSVRFFRDVAIVDGKPVRDRQERLRKLFLGQSPGGIREVMRLYKESTRYDIKRQRFLEFAGAVLVPFLPVKAVTRDRFRFTEADGGVSFVEVTSPSMFRIRRPFGEFHDMKMSGRLRIDHTSGVVSFGALMFADDQYEGTVEVEYTRHPTLAMQVPLRMRERYRNPGRPKEDFLDVVSEYSNFRRFEVKTSEDVQLPK